jgi:flagellar biogenesis protein FliO
MGIAQRSRHLQRPFRLGSHLLLIIWLVSGQGLTQGQEFPTLPPLQSPSSLRDSEVRPAAWSGVSESHGHSDHRRPDSLGGSSQANWDNNSSAMRVAQPVSGRTRVQEPSSVQSVSPSAVGDSIIGKTATPLQPKSTAAQPSQSPRRSALQIMVSLGSSLAVVLSLFLGLAWAYRKSIVKTGGTGLPKTVVQVLGKTTLAPRQQLVLLRFGSKLVLVSNIQGETRTVSEIVDPLEVDQLTGLCESNRPGSISHSFREILSHGARP